MILGKISAVDDTNGLQLTIDGEETPTQKKYRYLASYVPAAGDKVAIEESGGSYVVMGKLIDSTEMAGIVKKAAEADHAAKATSADSAAQADTATTANNAENSTNSTTSQNVRGFSFDIVRVWTGSASVYALQVFNNGNSQGYWYKDL